jgi:N-acetylglutamate synthase-like GNAT family acetyltransferase
MLDPSSSEVPRLRNAEYGTQGFQFEDPAVRHLRESDIPSLIELFQRSYGSSYPYPQLADHDWIRREVHRDDHIWLVIEEEGELIGCGALRLDVGDHNDQLGEIGRVVVHPDHMGRKVGRRIIAALLDAADDVLEFAYGDTRTQHRFAQVLVEGAGFFPIGFSPQRYVICGRRESAVTYGRLFDNGRNLRRPRSPALVPPAVPLAVHVLGSMSLPTDVEIADARPCEPLDVPLVPEPITRETRAALIGLDVFHRREPPVFGHLSIDQGLFHLARRKAAYNVYRDPGGRVAGALGFHFDPFNGALRVLELIASEDHARGGLCEAIVREGEKVGAALIEINVSAYEAELQATLVDQGFVAVAYQPGMVFHGRERLDVVRLMRLTLPHNADMLDLTSAATTVHELVGANFR